MKSILKKLKPILLISMLILMTVLAVYEAVRDYVNLQHFLDNAETVTVEVTGKFKIDKIKSIGYTPVSKTLYVIEYNKPIASGKFLSDKCSASKEFHDSVAVGDSLSLLFLDDEYTIKVFEDDTSRQNRRFHGDLIFGIISIVVGGVIVLYVLFRGKIKAESEKKTPDTLRGMFFQNIAHIAAIPFLGQVFVLFLISPFILLPMFLWMGSFTEAELETTGMITWLPQDRNSLAREIPYTYEVDGESYEGTWQWVTLRNYPDLEVGSEIKIYYHQSAPRFARTEHDPTNLELSLFAVGVWIVVIIGILLNARSKLKKQRIPVGITVTRTEPRADFIEEGDAVKPKRNMNVNWVHLIIYLVVGACLIAVGAKTMLDGKMPESGPNSVALTGNYALVVGGGFLFLGLLIIYRSLSTLIQAYRESKNEIG